MVVTGAELARDVLFAEWKGGLTVSDGSSEEQQTGWRGLVAELTDVPQELASIGSSLFARCGLETSVDDAGVGVRNHPQALFDLLGRIRAVRVERFGNNQAAPAEVLAIGIGAGLLASEPEALTSFVKGVC